MEKVFVHFGTKPGMKVIGWMIKCMGKVGIHTLTAMFMSVDLNLDNVPVMES
jgi:hypothetical protein